MYTGFTQFILSYFVTGFLTLSGKTNGVKTNAGHDNTEIALTTNLVCKFFNTFCLSEEIKEKCIAIIQNYHLITKVTRLLQNFDANLKSLFWNSSGRS